MSYLINPYIFGYVSTDELVAFRAVKSATTQTAGADIEVVYDSEVFNIGSNFASNRFTVPASINGYYLHLRAGVETDNFEVHNIEFQRSTDSGSTFDPVATDGDSTNENVTLSSGPLLCATGDIYRVQYHLVSGAGTLDNTDLTFFSGFATP